MVIVQRPRCSSAYSGRGDFQGAQHQALAIVH